MKQTQEKQYQFLLDRPMARFGLMSSQVWQDDPRRLTFLLARYKFVSKMFSGMNKVLEVGCADAFGSRIVKQEVGYLMVSDFDPIFIENAKTIQEDPWVYDFCVHDMMQGAVVTENGFDGVYCCDVLEHIQPSDEAVFVRNLADSLNAQGALIVGSPSLESQTYASPPSKAGHVNCKTAKDMKALMQRFFHNVFIFSMNDEVVHTGFYPMAHYLFALCTHRKV